MNGFDNENATSESVSKSVIIHEVAKLQVLYPISVPHPVDVVFQFFQFGGEVRQTVESRAQVQRAPPAAAATAEFASEEVGRRPTQISIQVNLIYLMSDMLNMILSSTSTISV